MTKSLLRDTEGTRWSRCMTLSEGRLPCGDSERIEWVSCDLGVVYPSGVLRNFPNAVIIHDHFHVPNCSRMHSTSFFQTR